MQSVLFNSSPPYIQRLTSTVLKQAQPSFTPCARCGKRDKIDYNRCSKCKVARYCSQDCQRSHWTQHKVWCAQEATRQEAVRRDTANQPPGTVILSSNSIFRFTPNDLSFDEFLNQSATLQHISLKMSPLIDIPFYMLHWGEDDPNISYFARACLELSKKGTDRIQGYLSRLPADVLVRVVKVFLCGIETEENQLTEQRIACPDASGWIPAVLESISNCLESVENDVDRLDLLYIEACVRLYKIHTSTKPEISNDKVQTCKRLSADLFTLACKYADASDHSPRILQSLLVAAKLTFIVKYYETSKSTLTYAKRIIQMAVGISEPSARLKHLEEQKSDQQLEEYKRLLHCALALYMADTNCQIFLGNWQEAKVSSLVAQDIVRQLHSPHDEANSVCHTCTSKRMRARIHIDDVKLQPSSPCAISEYTDYSARRCDELLAKQALAYSACQN